MPAGGLHPGQTLTDLSAMRSWTDSLLVLIATDEPHRRAASVAISSVFASSLSVHYSLRPRTVPRDGVLRGCKIGSSI